MSPGDLQALNDLGGSVTAFGVLLALLFLIMSNRLITRGRFDDARSVSEYHQKRADKAEETIVEITQKYEQLIVVLQGIQEVLRQRVHE